LPAAGAQILLRYQEGLDAGDAGKPDAQPGDDLI
jgi:hypothetical protein